MLDRVAGIISRYSMIAPGGRVGVAVSGGADSVCLLHLLKELAPVLGLCLTVVHLNHKLRGAESDGDEEFVRDLAASLECPLLAGTANVAGAGGNLEEAGREARRSFYRSLIASSGLDRVATGHTSSDQAETVLYRLLRGSGTAGISAIRPFTADGIIRPLIDCNREEVEAYLTQRGIRWREDRTNQDRAFQRNRIRHDLLPQLRKEYNPALPQALAQMAVLAQEDEQYWGAEMDRIASKELKQSGGAVFLVCPRLVAMPGAVARRLLRRAVSLAKGDLRQIDFEHIDALLQLAAGGEGHGRLQLPDLDVFRSFEWMRIAPPRAGSRSDRDYCYEVVPPIRVRIPGEGFSIRLDLLEMSGGIPLDRAETGYTETSGLLDLERLAVDGTVDRLALRNWRPGDRYSRPGRSTEKVKTLFQQQRIPIWERQGWPILTIGDRIVWVRRFGAAAEVSSSASTSRAVCVTEIAEAG
ncbi:MAG: tRNA lysidine(34) synthetase TilS [Bryobacteraceae bacterium]